MVISKKLAKGKKQVETIEFGIHLMIDAYNCNEKDLDDANFVYSLLEGVVQEIDMHMLTLPYIVRAKGNNIKDPGGWSGFVIIEESHMSIHTFPKRRFASIDIYSCKYFDVEKTVALLKNKLKTDMFEQYVQKRGLMYPKYNY